MKIPGLKDPSQLRAGGEIDRGCDKRMRPNWKGRKSFFIKKNHSVFVNAIGLIVYSELYIYM